jgi:TIR domain
VADVFISYSHEDKSAAREFATYLEAQGYSVWWDKNLKAGEDFQLEIHKQIWPAKAVIVLWSKSSVKSTFVRAEAAAAQRENKLIPLKLSGTAYEDILQPYNLLHTEDFDNRSEILAAINTQLAKPAPASRFLKQLQYEALTWLGILGSVVTIFSNLAAIIKMAQWAKWVSDYWVYGVAEFWTRLGHVISVNLPKSYAGPLSACLFFMAVAIGSRNADKRARGQRFLLASVKAFSISTVISYIFISLKYRTLNPFSVVDVLLYQNIDRSALQTIAFVIFLFSFIFSIFEGWRIPTAIMMSLAYAIISSVILTTMVLSAEARYGGLQGGNEIYVVALAMPATILGAFLIAPVKGLVRRLIGVAILVGFLACLNELAKLGYQTI